VVALGDSLTDANISTHDAYCRWPDQLARRLVARHDGRPLGVLNQGLGGNRILFDLRGDSGLRRFDRDVLAQPGVTHAIVMLGTNDLRNRNAKSDEEVSAEQMIAGLDQMALRAQARGIKLIGATLTPFGNETFLPGAWNPVREGHRVAVNSWIRESDALHGVVDFDKALRDPERPTQMLPIYDCGDGLHPRLLQDGRRNRPGAARLGVSPSARTTRYAHPSSRHPKGVARAKGILCNASVRFCG
jgi:lysophospholipase L1-like esterase